MPDEEWDALGPHRAEPGTLPPRPIETHPQFHLKLILDRMGVARGEVGNWRGGGGWRLGRRFGSVAAARSPTRWRRADFTGKWTTLAAADRRLAGVTAAELATPAEEAQAIALALREAVENAGRTAALVTPDRALARRVAAHLGAGGSPSTTPPASRSRCCRPARCCSRWPRRRRSASRRWRC